jgi:hypothetical protein
LDLHVSWLLITLMHKLIALHGSTEPLPDETPLRAGHIDVVYQSGFLRYLSINGKEIIRMINFLIRDETWKTIPMTVTDEEIERGDASFRIAYTGMCDQGGIQFRWKCRIVGKEDSSIRLSFEGEALSTFKRNRLGFTVLHPIESCAGKPCTIVHPDASSEVRRFPITISPDQPFLNIAAMEWEPAPGYDVNLLFDGDIFETEDQRNWTDASFKTYCTPLAKPFPVTVEKGTVIRQAIELKVASDQPQVETKGTAVSFTIDPTTTQPFPQVGLSLSNLPHEGHLWEKIEALSPDFIRISLRSTDRAHTPAVLSLLERGIAIELFLFLDGTLSESFQKLLDDLRERVVHVVILPLDGVATTPAVISRFLSVVHSTFPDCAVGGGTDAFFTELNRERTPVDELDFLTFSINPQVHAVDIRTMTENLGALGDVVNSCKTFSGGKGVHVSPVTLRTRTSGRASPGSWAPGAPLPTDVDARQLSLFAAAWTLGCFKHLADSGVAAVTFFETCGWRGLLPHPQQPWPNAYRVGDKGVYPVYLALRSLMNFRDRRVARLISSNPLVMDGLALVSNRNDLAVLLANYTERMQEVLLPQDFLPKFYRSIGAHNVVRLRSEGQLGELRRFSADRVVNLPPFSLMLLE